MAMTHDELDVRFGRAEWEVAFAAARRVLRVADQAEDAAQEALLRAYRALDSLRGRDQLHAWLRRIARNTALDHLRAEARRIAITSLACERRAPAVAPESALCARTLARALEATLAGLSAVDRAAFVARFLEGRDQRELGRSLGLSPNAAKVRAFRARRAVWRGLAVHGITRAA